ncbi:MAG: MarR family winged helix-turn-helix transcriptional regulator [Motilibacteraceae bacterium]
MDSTATGIGYLLKQVQGRLHTALAAALKDHDLTVAQYATLVAVNDEPGLSNADLARRAFVTPQSSHRLLAELEEAGLVVRTPHPAHRRVLQSQLTAAGSRRLQRANVAADAVEKAMLRGLSAMDLKALKAALQSCDAQLEDLTGRGAD